jgi:hypothetical protein
MALSCDNSPRASQATSPNSRIVVTKFVTTRRSMDHLAGDVNLSERCRPVALGDIS